MRARVALRAEVLPSEINACNFASSCPLNATRQIFFVPRLCPGLGWSASTPQNSATKHYALVEHIGDDPRRSAGDQGLLRHACLDPPLPVHIDGVPVAIPSERVALRVAHPDAVKRGLKDASAQILEL